MEDFEIETIKKNLPELIRVTDCNELLIAELTSRDALSLADLADLKRETNWISSNYKLYHIMQTRLNGFTHLKESLRKTNQSGALKLLEGSRDQALPLPLAVPTPATVFFNVLLPTVLFTGRQEELKILEKSLQEPMSMAVISGKSCITGLGGIGKTDLARKLIQNISTKFEYIIWINAENNISTSKDFKTLAMDKFGISIYSGPGHEKDISVILDDVYSRLALKTSLVVFDNVENATFIHKFFPKVPHSASNIHILITSQDNDWDLQDLEDPNHCLSLGTQITLSGLEPADAVNFVKRGLAKLHTKGERTIQRDSNFDDLKLVTRLEFFPLAIGQAIAFIRERRKIHKNYGPKEYINDLDKDAEAILNRPISGFLSLTGYNKSTYLTFRLTLEKLNEHKNGKFGIQLIKLMAFMSPDNIESRIFEEVFKKKSCLEDSLLLLERYSIVRLVPKEEENDSLKVNIHRLVQHVMRCIIEVENQTEETLEKAKELLESKMKPSNVDHAISIWHHIAKLPKQVLIKHYVIPEQIFWILFYDHRLVDALEFVNLVLNTLSKRFDYEDNCEFFLKYQACVCYVLDFQVKNSECKAYVQKAIERALNYKQPYDHCILPLRHIEIGQEGDYYNASEDILQKYCGLYDDWKRTLGDTDNIYSLRTLYKIGYQNSCLKRYEEAIAISQKVCDCIAMLEITPVNARRANVLALSSKLTIANSFAFVGKLDRAIQEFEFTLSEVQLQANQCTDELIMIQHDFAVKLFYAGDFVKSLECSQFAYACYLKAFSDDHITPMSVQFNIALAKSELDQDDAHKLALDIFQYFESTFGKNHPRGWLCKALIGKILSKMERHIEAIKLLENTVNDSNFLEKMNALLFCMFKYHYVYSLAKSNQIDKALIHLVALREQVLPISDLFYIKPKVLTLYEELTSSKKQCLANFTQGTSSE